MCAILGYTLYVLYALAEILVILNSIFYINGRWFWKSENTKSKLGQAEYTMIVLGWYINSKYVF